MLSSRGIERVQFVTGGEVDHTSRTSGAIALDVRSPHCRTGLPG